MERKDVEVKVDTVHFYGSWTAHLEQTPASFYMKCRNSECYVAVALVMDKDRGACGICPRCGTVTYPGQTKMARDPKEIEDPQESE